MFQTTNQYICIYYDVCIGMYWDIVFFWDNIFWTGIHVGKFIGDIMGGYNEHLGVSVEE